MELSVTKTRAAEFIVSLMFVTSTFVLLLPGGYTAFLWCQMAFCAYMLFLKKKLYFFPSVVVTMVFVMMFVSGVLAQSTDMPDSYRKAAIVLPIMMLPLYFTATYLVVLIKDSYSWLDVIKKAILISLIVQLVWILIQLLFYRVFSIDINHRLFVELLHMTNKASFIRAGVWYPSGLTHHSAQLAPLFVMGFLMFDNWYLRLAIIVESMMIGSSTSTLGILLCAAGVICYNIAKKKKRTEFGFSNMKIIVFVFAAVAAVIIALRFNVFEIISRSVSNIYMRLFAENKDDSTAAHLSYYTDYLTFIKRESRINVLFGCGNGCSGWLITSLYNRYRSLGNWAIESDIIDILVSRGIVGFVLYYSLLVRIMIKGLKVDYRYALFIVVLLIQGFGYNVQFDYLFLFEMLLLVCVEKNINVFGGASFPARISDLIPLIKKRTV